MKHTTNQKKYILVLLLPLDLIASTYCISQPVLTLLFHLEELQGTDYLVEQHQYSMHHLGRHSNNLNLYLQPQFYRITEGTH